MYLFNLYTAYRAHAWKCPEFVGILHILHYDSDDDDDDDDNTISEYYICLLILGKLLIFTFYRFGTCSSDRWVANGIMQYYWTVVKNIVELLIK